VSEFSLSPQLGAAPANLGQRLDYLRGFLHRQYLPILLCLALALPIGAFYAFTSPKTYAASAIMMIETRKGPLDGANAPPPDVAWFETHVQNLKSMNVLGFVVKQLNLADDPEFQRGEASRLDRLLSRIGWSAPLPGSDAERISRAVELLGSGLGVQRIGQSYMIKIDVTGRNPELAAKIANEMVNGYIFDQMNAKYQASRSAGDWLQERLQNLRDQAAAAERAVVQFKAKNNMVSAGGTLMNDKQLSDVSDELGKARARAADLQARLERMEAVRQTYQQEYSKDQPGLGVDETFAEAMSNSIITPLRAKYLDLVNREADYAARLGANHVATVNLRNQIRDIRRSIYDELGRIEETAKSELAIAKKRQNELETALTNAVSKTQDTNQAQVVLFSLEAAAKSYRALYDNFLRQHTETVQQQTYPISDARLISSASVKQTGPQRLKIWFATIFFGGILGVGFGALRELLDRGFRTSEQVKSVLNTDCIALIPRLGKNPGAQWLSYAGATQMASGLRSLLVPSPSARVVDDDPRRRSRVLWAAVNAPNSAYADAIRSIKLSLDSESDAGCNVIGLTSYLPTEGKSTVAAGIATQMAQGGRRVILIDCDVRNPSLSRALTPDTAVGLLEVIAGEANLAQAVRRDAKTNLAFLPVVTNKSLRDRIELLASREAKLLINLLRTTYDYVIIDMAPLISTVDVLAVSRFVESYVLVIEWGATKMELVRYALGNTPAVQMKMIGAVLNKVDYASLARYEPYGANHHYAYGYGRPGFPPSGQTGAPPSGRTGAPPSR
jgi:polysaccharide biosynthesis transport protein